jgi:hypothetical protein
MGRNDIQEYGKKVRNLLTAKEIVRITGSQDFVHLPGFQINRQYEVSKLDLFPSLCVGRETPNYRAFGKS